MDKLGSQVSKLLPEDEDVEKSFNACVLPGDVHFSMNNRGRNGHDEIKYQLHVTENACHILQVHLVICQ